MALKPKKCRSCKEAFTPVNSMQVVCSFGCGLQYVHTVRAKKEAQEIKQFKAETRVMKKALNDKSVKYWEERAKSACHKYIRERDKHLPCVSCGTIANVQYAAGHFRPSGVNSALRYDERNIHKQCNMYCNSGMSGNLTPYRIELVKRLGEDVVEWLESNHEVKRWTIDELKQIEADYKAKLKALN